jgi:hypothetical protein
MPMAVSTRRFIIIKYSGTLAPTLSSIRLKTLLPSDWVREGVRELGRNGDKGLVALCTS